MSGKVFLACGLWGCLWLTGTLWAEEPIRVACLGDSITEGAGLKQPWPAKLQQMLGDEYEVRNFGVGAATLLRQGAKPYHLQPEYQEAVEFKPQIVLVMLGCNDSVATSAKLMGQFSGDYRQLVKPFQRPGTRLLSLTPAVVQKGSWGIDAARVRTVIAPRVRATAKTIRVSLIDIHKAFEGEMRPLWSDGVHLNQAGSDLVAETVFQAIQGK